MAFFSLKMAAVGCSKVVNSKDRTKLASTGKFKSILYLKLNEKQSE